MQFNSASVGNATALGCGGIHHDELQLICLQRLTLAGQAQAFLQQFLEEILSHLFAPVRHRRTLNRKTVREYPSPQKYL